MILADRQMKVHDLREARGISTERVHFINPLRKRECYNFETFVCLRHCISQKEEQISMRFFLFESWVNRDNPMVYDNIDNPFSHQLLAQLLSESVRCTKAGVVYRASQRILTNFKLFKR